MKRVVLILGLLLLVSSARAQTIVIVPAHGENYDMDFGDADIVKFQPTCYGQPGCSDGDGYSFAIDTIVARPSKPRAILYFGSYPGYTVTLRHGARGGAGSQIVCPDYHDIVIELRNHSMELYYDSTVGVWRPLQ